MVAGADALEEHASSTSGARWRRIIARRPSAGRVPFDIPRNSGGRACAYMCHSGRRAAQSGDLRVQVAGSEEELLERVGQLARRLARLQELEAHRIGEAVEVEMGRLGEAPAQRARVAPRCGDREGVFERL